MSLEDELAELSTVYHGQRERVEELAKELKHALTLVNSQQEQIEKLKLALQELWLFVDLCCEVDSRDAEKAREQLRAQHEQVIGQNLGETIEGGSDAAKH